MKIENENFSEAESPQLNIGVVSSSSIQMNTFRQELIDLYMQGWLDRDWKIGEDEADEKAEMYADQIMKNNKL
jgi:hypothetical protein